MKILVSESRDFAEEAAALLRQAAELELADLDRPGLLARAADAEVLWVRLRHRIDREVFAAAPQLQLVVTATTGLDHIDLEEAARRGVRILSLRGETEFLRDIRATAEHTIALMLVLLRHIPAAFEHVRAGAWERDRFRGEELHGKTVGIVGYGRLGRIVGRYLRAFDAHVLAADGGHVRDPEPGIEPVDLPELLRRSDIVSLHASLSAETRRLIGADEIALMKPGAWLVNTARGELVDETALLAALRERRLAGAALDVLVGERPSGMAEHPLVAWARDHDNLILTPHIGGATEESMTRTEVFMAERLLSELASPAEDHGARR